MKKILFIILAVFLLAVFVKADEIDTTIAQYDSSTDAQETSVLTELETESSVTEEQVATELSMPEEVLTEYNEVEKTIGPRQYILNRQLKHRIKVTLKTSEVILKHLERKNVSTTELVAIQQKIKDLDASIDPKTMTKAGFDEKLALLKGYIREFKLKASSLSSESEKEAMRAEANEEVKKLQDDNISKLARLHNRMQYARALRVIKNDAIKFRQDNEKLLMLKERMIALHQIRQQYLHNNATNVSREDIEALKSEWKERLRNYREDQKSARELARQARVYTQGIKQNMTREQVRQMATEIKDVNKDNIQDKVRAFKENKLNRGGNAQ